MYLLTLSSLVCIQRSKSTGKIKRKTHDEGRAYGVCIIHHVTKIPHTKSELQAVAMASRARRGRLASVTTSLIPVTAFLESQEEVWGFDIDNFGSLQGTVCPQNENCSTSKYTTCSKAQRAVNRVTKRNFPCIVFRSLTNLKPTTVAALSKT
jgi:hypothetical protein